MASEPGPSTGLALRALAQSHPQALAETAPPEPYSKADLLEYLAFCLCQVDEQTACLNPEAESGFPWLPFSKVELQFYNIRPIQQHIGELMERLGSRADVEFDWVALKDG